MAKVQQDFTKEIKWETEKESTVLVWQIKTIGQQWEKCRRYDLTIQCFILNGDFGSIVVSFF